MCSLLAFLASLANAEGINMVISLHAAITRWDYRYDMR